MEQLSWKDADIQSDFKNCKNLGELVKEIEQRQSAQGNVICKITVNGMNLDEMDEQRFSESTIAEIESLDVHYTAIRTLVYETEASTINYAKGLVPVAVEVSELFRSSNLNHAHTSFKSLVESLDSLMQANQLILNVRHQERLGVSDKLIDLDQKFVRLLSEILGSYEKRDFILTADVLEYDLAQNLTELYKTLEENVGKSDVTEKDNTLVR